MKKILFCQRLVVLNLSIMTIDNPNVFLKFLDSYDNSIEYTIENSGDVPDGEYDVTVYAKDGFILDSVDFFDGRDFRSFEVSDDKKTAQETYFNVYTDIGFTIVTIVVQPDPPPESDGVSGFNHLYMVDKIILRDISKERFVRQVGENEIDLGEYIVNVLELPFSIGDKINGLETQITLGGRVIETKAVELLDDEIVIGLGEITIPSKYKNSYDYLNTNIYLHLPFIQKIELNVDYLINETITIQYIINLFTGDTSVIIKSTKLDGEIIHNESVKIGKNIPFINKNGYVEGELQNNIGLNNQLYNPFIEVIRNRPYELTNYFNDDIFIKTNLLNEKGFMIVKNIMLNTDATLKEQDRIISILSNGIYIK